MLLTHITNTDQNTELWNYIISRWHRPCMIYGEEEEERHWGGAIQMHIQRDIEGNQRMRWCEHLPTYIWISMLPSSSGHTHMETPKNGDLERRSQVEEPFSPWVFSLMFQTLVQIIGPEKYAKNSSNSTEVMWINY